MDEVPTHERFQALAGQRVELCLPEIELTAVIDEVSAHTRQDSSAREPFSVVFVTDSDDNHGQQIYTLKHPELGAVEMFLVPLGPKGDGMRYEAVIT